MNYTHPRTTFMVKCIGSIMTILFSFMAFTYAQSCQLLPGRSPSTLADGQSRTGYQIPVATLTHTCASSAGLITCISGVIPSELGNAYPYSSCTQPTWSNCTTPIAANHLEFKVIYKANHNTFTQDCDELSQHLQCLNGIFTGGIDPQLYNYGTCTQQSRNNCIDNRTTPASYKAHGEVLLGYTANHPGLGQTCETIKKPLTCQNGTRAGNGNAQQAGLVTSCTNPGAFSGCYNTRTHTTVPHGSSLNAYTSPTGVCTGILRPLTCVNGLRSGGTQASLYSGCTQIGTNSCPNIITYTGANLSHGTFITKYTQPFAFTTLNQTCSGFSLVLQCNNGSWGGNAAYTGCQNVASGSCKNIRTNKYIPHLQYIYGYSSPTPSASLGCEGVKIGLLCKGGSRYTTGNTLINQQSLFSGCSSCILPRGGTLGEGESATGFSVTGTLLPKTCSSYATTLTCSGGILQGNRQTYKHSTCDGEELINGIDLTIDESKGLQGQEQLSVKLVAQGSSPEINILFKNKGDTLVNQGFSTEGFLSCDWVEQGINVYKSRAITSFVVNPGTKVGVNIRLKTIFTQALGQKTLKCTLNAGMIDGGDEVSTNNTREAKFEVVAAERFDLALSKSIESISKNLESAEGAMGTQGLQNFVFTKVMNVLVPLIIVLGILSAILGFYKIMFSSDEKAISEGTRYIIFGVIGIIVIMSAKFIGQNVYDLLNPATGDIKGYEMASGLYNNIVYPFIKLAIYLVLGAMFVILVSRVITFLFGSDSDAVKKAGTLIGWNVISMIIIIGAKQIVEAIYGQQDNVVKDITNLGEVGSGILADKNIPILYQIINYALGIASLVILVVIIIQTVKLLTKPDDPAQVKSIKSSLMYMFIGILVLGAGYLIVNFAIIN